MRNGTHAHSSVALRAGLLFLLLAAPGCVKTGAPGGAPHPGTDVVKVPESDSAMNAAIEKAKATMPEFEALLRAPRPGQNDFSVKSAFPTKDGGVEHIWLGDLRFESDSVSGTVNNDPEFVANLTLGQRVAVKRSTLSDWMYIENGVVKGGYTVRVLFDRMTPAERAQNIAAMGVRLD